MTRTLRPAACGTWLSPISAAHIAGSGTRLMQPRIAGDWTYWVESRPMENGRCVLVRGQTDESKHNLTPPPFSVRSRVHEYGGGAFACTATAVYFVNDRDQQIYTQSPQGGIPKVLTRATARRFADLLVDARRQRLVCVCEDHGAGDDTPLNTLGAVSVGDGHVSTLAQGYDFYSSPALNAESSRLAWLCWNQPQMPWDGCELWLADLDENGISRNSKCIAGGVEESIFQPQFAPDGALYFISDRDGFWNIYKYADGEIHAVTHDQMDYGCAQWNFGISSYGFMADGTIFATRMHRGCSELVRIGVDGAMQQRYSGFTQIEHLHVNQNRLALLASTPTQPPVVSMGDGEQFMTISAPDGGIPLEFLTAPELIDFPTSAGETAHAWYYPPHNADFSVSTGEKPPLMVRCHGGPTTMNGNGLDLRIQYWSSRGFAVVDVNYRGSSGYGRAYRRSLHGEWGIKDVQDCIHAARYLVSKGQVDEKRLVISGSSAGGFTVLCALAFHDYFKAAAVYYGISELETAMTDTHKFEARYANSLLGPWPAARDLYRSRSPLYAVANINCPVIFFQGLKDRVVPPRQTQRMVTALRAKKLPVAYLTFAEEGHGFRGRDAIQHALESELAFYALVLGFAPVDVPPLPSESLSGQA